MSLTLEKLRPDQDLQCFFFQPSAIAALSSTSATGFTLSGTWRQQFDWAVVEWNRDNVYEHPAFRNLPDGDLSGLTLSYEETRSNCIPLDSQLFATVDWPSLRVWATPVAGVETIYYVPLKSHAEAIEGSYQCAYADFTLGGAAVGGDYVGLAFLSEHYTYQLFGSDTLSTTVQAIAASVNAFSTVLKATVSGATIRLYYTGGTAIATSTAGANGNRFGVYSYSTGTATWDAAGKSLSSGTSPSKWKVTLEFGSLFGWTNPLFSGDPEQIPTSHIRKMRWTYAADLQAAEFQRSEFAVAVSNWVVSGTGRPYAIAGRGSFRIEDHDPAIAYQGQWTEERGNFSAGTIHKTSANGATASFVYQAPLAHDLYLGLRYTGNSGAIAISADGNSISPPTLNINGEDTLFRFPCGSFAAGQHTMRLEHTGPNGTDVFFEFLELARPQVELPEFPVEAKITLATDWDTLHSISIAPERTAWFLDSLGFVGRANHYVGALWFYELVRSGHQYASASVEFSGTPDPNFIVTVTLGRFNQPALDTVLQRLIHVGDTASTIALSFAQELNRGYTGVWASATGGTLTIHSRSMGNDGNVNTIASSTTSANLNISVPNSSFTGGENGDWRTDLTAMPRLNRAVRDWSASYYTALAGYNIDIAAAFSMELQHGDPSAAAGIAQRGPAGDPILLPTPALQTNFSPASTDFWKQVYLDMAAVQAAAGLVPYLQFGEVQWWYFPNDGLGFNYSGMPFYDAWNQSNFQSIYGHSLATIGAHTVNPADYPDEVAYLPTVIGAFTSAVMSHVRATHPDTRFEVLYPTDVNQTDFNRAINYPAGDWTAVQLDSLKTESFGFTFGKNLDKSFETINFGLSGDFPATQRSHLIGIGDSFSAWQKETREAEGRGLESVVLFAVDQFCLIGYPLPLSRGLRRAVRFGG